MESRLHSPVAISPGPLLLLATLPIVGLLVFTGCRHEKSDTTVAAPTNAVAVVGSGIITVEMFRNELARRARSAPGNVCVPGQKQALLDEMVRSEVLHQKALAAGYDRNPQIVASIRQMIVSKFEEDQLAKSASPPPTAVEIDDYYSKNPQRFGTPAKLRAALIELTVARTATAAKRAEVAAHAQAVRAEALTNSPPDHTFGSVAQMHSEHQSSRYRGGDIGWLTVDATNHQWPPALIEALSKLAQPGETSPVIETSSAFYLIRLVERQPAKMRPLAEVKDGVAYLVTREKARQRQEEWHEALKQGLNIEINRALLDSIAMPDRETKPPSLPGEPTHFPPASAGRFSQSNGITSGITLP